MMKNSDKINSSLSKIINRLRHNCIILDKSNRLRKYQIQQFNLFITKLLQENRITKEEISQFIHKKENINK